MARLAPSNLEPGALAENVSGSHFGKDNRIDCDLCRQTAPLYFARKHVGNMGRPYFQQQPLSLHQERLCREALDACLVEAIGYKLA